MITSYTFVRAQGKHLGRQDLFKAMVEQGVDPELINAKVVELTDAKLAKIGSCDHGLYTIRLFSYWLYFLPSSSAKRCCFATPPNQL